VELLSLFLLTFAGVLAMVWRPDSEDYIEQLFKALLPIILALMSMLLQK
jgi:hypothetical protein